MLRYFHEVYENYICLQCQNFATKNVQTHTARLEQQVQRLQLMHTFAWVKRLFYVNAFCVITRIPVICKQSYLHRNHKSSP